MIDIRAPKICGELVEYRPRPESPPSVGTIMAIRPPHVYVQIKGRSVAATPEQLSWRSDDAVVALHPRAATAVSTSARFIGDQRGVPKCAPDG